MSTAQLGCVLFNDLKHMGVILPDNSQEITILVNGPDDVAKIITKGSAWDTRLKHKVFYIENSSGYFVTGKMFYELVKDKMQLPNETTKFRIVIKPDEVVTTVLETATPAGSLDFLSECSLISDDNHVHLKEKIKKSLEAFKTKRAHAT